MDVIIHTQMLIILRFWKGPRIICQMIRVELNRLRAKDQMSGDLNVNWNL